MALLDTVEGYGWEESADDLEERMRDFYPGVMKLAYSDANAALPVDVAFDLSNPAIKKTIRQLARKVRNVTETTRDEIRAIIDRGTEAGLSVSDMAKQIRERGEIASKTRSLTIARTESAVAYSTGSVLAYKEAGVTKVEVLDSDDDEECASANGAIWTLEEAMEHPIGHPNCQRSFAPVVE